jgi:hypothetical protein
MTEVHVIPDERTTWRVCDADADAPLSEHPNATEAEAAARGRAGDRDADRVVVHDRYDAGTRLRGRRLVGRARERLEAARRVARVGERVRQLTGAAGRCIRETTFETKE